MPSKPYWKNTKFWVCPRHLPSVNIPGHIDKCWYAGCLSVRPEKEVDPFADFDAATLKKISKNPSKRKVHSTTAKSKTKNKTASSVTSQRKKAVSTPAKTQTSSPKKTQSKKSNTTKIVTRSVEENTVLCAWFKCDKDNGSPAKARNQSKYCSRDCSNRNARYRMKQRKKEDK